MASTPDGFDHGRATKAVIEAIRNRHRASGLSSTPDKASSGSRADFQRTRYAANEEDRIYKTYSAGTAAASVHYEGNELRIIEGSDDESEQPPQESVKGLSVKVVSLKPHASRTASYKKTAGRGKILSGHVRPRSVGNSQDLAGKSNEEEAIQIARMKEDRVTTRSSQGKSKQDVDQ
ncbi:uncharacterized protein LOC124341787 [Daphnia pulicaria]|uniref:uncharacterized protein LOC124341787 n=1 Tax=Daphnia pulicaria TaxID=35523 RepID=UPI001EEB68B8|nr:uncharacterized protein LOC124341787 [Daphnia pulicaria]